ncbi:antitoxin MazE-like protein [Paraburkholderia dokdonensis]|uniref:antitoxin MazE-like protein n=1 Tax=Paraburkholderia dokdonensis TaxID=2211211 RepID=UPI00101A7530|nr:antitoxin MazE-like protein [Paraburkholderia dokdonensis]
MSSINESSNDVARYRERMRAAGCGPAQFCGPEARSPELTTMLRCQCRNLHDDSAETDAIGFAETAAGLIESWE